MALASAAEVTSILLLFFKIFVESYSVLGPLVFAVLSLGGECLGGLGIGGQGHPHPSLFWKFML